LHLLQYRYSGRSTGVVDGQREIIDEGGSIRDSPGSVRVGTAAVSGMCGASGPASTSVTCASSGPRISACEISGFAREGAAAEVWDTILLLFLEASDGWGLWSWLGPCVRGRERSMVGVTSSYAVPPMSDESRNSLGFIVVCVYCGPTRLEDDRQKIGVVLSAYISCVTRASCDHLRGG
jgi:hypothetical protein